MDAEPVENGASGDKFIKSLQDPMLLAALQAEKDAQHNILSSLPKSVRRRVNALKKLQLEAVKIESDFYMKVHELECEFAAKFQPLYNQRSKIICGDHEPNDEECDFPDPDLAAELTEKANVTDKPDADVQKEEIPDDPMVKGIPDFWLTLFSNVELLSDMIQEHDEAILKHLLDIQVQISKDPMKFVLLFNFSSNDYFTNNVLTKEYTLKCSPDDTEPFDFDGPEIIDCKGCKVDWKPNKNITVKLIKKKQKHRARGATRFVTKQVKADSFFNFFDPPQIKEDEPVDEELRELLNADFEIGQIIRDRIVPRAVLYFTGEVNDDDDSYDDEEGDEGDEEDYGEEEDEDDDDG